jgi:RNA polymerase sigma-70 factor (ECF subfamily)
MTDEKLVELAQNGIQDAVAQLYSKYVDAIYRFCYWQTNQSGDAEDLTSDVMLDMAKGLRHFAGKSSFKNWLYAIAKNHLQHWIREHKYELPLISLDDNLKVNEDWIDPDEQEGSRQRLASLFKKLTLREQKLLTLRFLRGYTVTETASALKVSESNVKVLTHRAITKLRTL